MTARHDLDRSIAAWLMDDAPTREPEHLLESVLGQTTRTRRRPAWRIPERWFPMSTLTSSAASTSRVPLRTIGVVALLVLGLAIGATVFIGARQHPLPAPFGPAANGQIVYGQDGDLYIRDTLDGRSRLLIGGPTIDVGPAYSNDGTRLAFLRITDDPSGEHADLWLANSDGSDQRRLSGPFDAPDSYEWAPGRDALAVESKVAGQRVITIVPTDGSIPKPVAVGTQPIEPMWRAPDGRQLIFRGIAADGTPGIYLVDRDGSNLTRIALDPGLPPGTAVTSDYFGDVSVSPDGNHIVFHSPTPDPTGPQGPGLQVHVVEIDASGNVLDDHRIPHLAGDADYYPAFTPQGDRIIFWRNPSGQSPSIQIAPLDGGPASTVALDCCLASDGSSGGVGRFFSPDGTQLLVVTGPDTAQVVDLESMDTAPADFTTDDSLTWQRIAPAR